MSTTNIRKRKEKMRSMSHKTRLNVRIDDKDALIKALEEMGYEVSEERRTLSAFSWQMETDLVVKKDGNVLNIGFKEQEDGSFKIEADFYGTGISTTEFQEQLNVLYGKHKVTNWLIRNRYTPTYETDEEGNLVVVGTRWI